MLKFPWKNKKERDEEFVLDVSRAREIMKESIEDIKKRVFVQAMNEIGAAAKTGSCKIHFMNDHIGKPEVEEYITERLESKGFKTRKAGIFVITISWSEK